MTYTWIGIANTQSSWQMNTTNLFQLQTNIFALIVLHEGEDPSSSNSISLMSQPDFYEPQGLEVKVEGWVLIPLMSPRERFKFKWKNTSLILKESIYKDEGRRKVGRKWEQEED